MSAGRVSKLAAPSAGRRNVNNNNDRPSPKRPATAGGGRNSQSTTSKSSSEPSSGSRLPRYGGGEDYVAVQYVNGRGAQTSQEEDVVEPRSQCTPGVTSLEQEQQQAVLAAHLQVSELYEIVTG